MRKLAAIAFGLAAVAGCNAVLGIEPGVFEPATFTDASIADSSALPAQDAKAPRDATPVVDAKAPDPEQPEAGPCVDLDNNPRHCGQCNRDCGPGACVKGECQPGAVVSGLDSSVIITVTTTHVYYASDNGVLRRAPVYGGAAAELFDAGALRPFGHNMVVIGDYLYFADQPRNRVARCPLLGACTPETIIGDFPKAYALATANGDLYAADGTFGTTIVVCKSPPCAQKDVVLSGEAGISLIAASNSDLAWATLEFNGKATIKSKPLAGGATTTLLSVDHAGLLGTSSLVMSGRDVYAVFLGELVHYSLDNPTVQDDLGDVDATETLRRDFAAFWYGDFYNGILYRRSVGTPRDAGSDEVARSEGKLYDVALDTVHPLGAYWAAGTTIWHLVR
jgi:hypothetical protein